MILNSKFIIAENGKECECIGGWNWNTETKECSKLDCIADTNSNGK
jgi:hypothetical protein